tara:strand:- start:1257 stop:2117 length:861 start_codon:yes stop_codon:yes gene_type:complete
MTDILITGGEGFLGKKLISKLKEYNYSYISLNSQDGDINKKDTFNSISKVKFVFHLAGKSFIPKSWDQNDELFKTNIIGTRNVINYCKRVNAKLIMASSYVYGYPEKLPINENHPVKPNNPYSLSKWISEQIIEFESKQDNLNAVILRIFNIFGNGQNKNFLIPKIINYIENNKDIEILDLKPKRDFVYIDDVVEAFILSMHIKDEFQRFNIGSGKSFSVGEIIKIIQEIFGTKLKVISQEKTRRNEIQNVIADISHARKVLKWNPRYTFHEGLNKYINEVVLNKS